MCDSDGDGEERVGEDVVIYSVVMHRRGAEKTRNRRSCLLV